MNKIINKFISIGSKNKNEADIYLYGDISTYDWWDNDVTPSKILDTLAELGNVGTLNLHINSYGGEVDAGNSINALLSNYRVKNGCTINAYIEGVAASMGSGIAMVADKIYQYSNALQMIHKPLISTWGNSDDLRKNAELLDKYEDILVNAYMKHYKGTEDELRQLLSDETWLKADEALECGLCDEILEPLEIAASAKGIKVNDYLFERKEIVDIFKEKVKNIREEKTQEMKYDEILNASFGITEEVFNAFKSPADFAEHIKNSALEPFANFVGENGEPIEMPTEFITLDMAKEKLSVEDITADEVLNLAEKGRNYKEPNPADEAKVTQFDKLFNELVDGAIANGIKAIGVDSFSEDTWKKTLANMSYNDVANISKTWETQAKIALNAGNQTSKKSIDIELLKQKQDEKNINTNF